jgi:putative flippase GtrA
VAVGAVSAVVDYGLLLVIMAVGVDYTLSKAISWVFGTLTAYALNRRWTFQAAPSKRRFVLSMALYCTTFAVQVGIFHFLYPWILGQWDNVWLAQTGGYVVAQGVATVINFFVQRLVIFRD